MFRAPVMPRLLRAVWQSEATNPCLPAPRRGHLVVLVDVPEGAVVDGVDVHRGVVAPAGAAGLRARAVNQHTLAEGHLAQRIALQPAGIADARVDCLAGHAVPEAHVAPLVHRDAAHPAMHAVVWSVRA